MATATHELPQVSVPEPITPASIVSLDTPLASECICNAVQNFSAAECIDVMEALIAKRIISQEQADFWATEFEPPVWRNAIVGVLEREFDTNQFQIELQQRVEEGTIPPQVAEDMVTRYVGSTLGHAIAHYIHERAGSKGMLRGENF